MRTLLLGCALIAAAALQTRADVSDRYMVLNSAKNLVLTTTGGATYYYLVSSDRPPVLKFVGNGQVTLGGDTFDQSEIKSIRLKNPVRYLLDEDSATFAADYSVDHGLLALRRTLNVGQWNSVVLPVALTGRQVLDAFGADAQAARVRGFRQGDNATIEYELVDLDTDAVALEANMHYILRPTRQPDVSADSRMIIGSSRPYGPIWLLPLTSLSAGQTPRLETLRSDDRSSRVMQRGTYTVRDGSSVLNRKVYVAGRTTYALDDSGLFGLHTDSLLVKAFSSWFDDMSTQPVSLHFRIDGISEDLTPILSPTAGRQPWQQDRRVYDLQGRPAPSSREALKKGVYIVGGRKVIIK